MRHNPQKGKCLITMADTPHSFGFVFLKLKNLTVLKDLCTFNHLTFEFDFLKENLGLDK